MFVRNNSIKGILLFVMVVCSGCITKGAGVHAPYLTERDAVLISTKLKPNYVDSLDDYELAGYKKLNTNTTSIPIGLSPDDLKTKKISPISTK